MADHELLRRPHDDEPESRVEGAASGPRTRDTHDHGDLPIGGRPVVICWVKRIWACPQPLCGQRTWTEQHPAIAPRASLTERARRWAFEQVGSADAAMAPGPAPELLRRALAALPAAARAARIRLRADAGHFAGQSRARPCSLTSSSPLRRGGSRRCGGCSTDWPKPTGPTRAPGGSGQREKASGLG